MKVFVLVMICLATFSKFVRMLKSDDEDLFVGHLVGLMAYIIAIIFQSINL